MSNHLHSRYQSARLAIPGHGDGLHFVTVCTGGRRSLFGEIRDASMHLTCAGRLAGAMWKTVAAHQPAVIPDTFVVMPDHIHVLFGIRPHGMDSEVPHASRQATVYCGSDEEETMGRLAVPGNYAHGVQLCEPLQLDRMPRPIESASVSSILHAYTSAVTRVVRLALNAPDLVVWQPEHHDHAVRSRREADDIRRYITEKPARWHRP